MKLQPSALRDPVVSPGRVGLSPSIERARVLCSRACASVPTVRTMHAPQTVGKEMCIFLTPLVLVHVKYSYAMHAYARRVSTCATRAPVVVHKANTRSPTSLQPCDFFTDFFYRLFLPTFFSDFFTKRSTAPAIPCPCELSDSSLSLNNVRVSRCWRRGRSQPPECPQARDSPLYAETDDAPHCQLAHETHAVTFSR
jgi:hypothetical protein